MSDVRKTGARALENITKKSSEEEKKAKIEETQASRSEISPEEAARIAEEKIARVTQVLSKGILNEKLASIIERSVPKGRIGKFVRDSEEDIIRYQNLGYTFEVNAGARGLHGTGDGRIRVGDLVLMTISQEDREILNIVRNRAIQQKLSAGRKEYTRPAERAAEASGISIFDESQTTIR